MLAVIPLLTALGVGGCAETADSTTKSLTTKAFTPTFESAPCPTRPDLPETTLGPEFSCGFLVVPERCDRPDGRTIKVAVTRARAQSADPAPDPLLYLTGGPGGPGLILGNGLVARGLNRDRDLIVIDQRGTLPGLPAEVLSLVPQLPRLVDECAVWDVGRADAAVFASVHSEIPALLQTGTRDAVTPPSQAELAADGLLNGDVIRIAGSGHDVLSGSPCAQQITVDFLSDPTGYDTGCAAALRVPAFD